MENALENAFHTFKFCGTCTCNAARNQKIFLDKIFPLPDDDDGGGGGG